MAAVSPSDLKGPARKPSRSSPLRTLCKALCCTSVLLLLAFGGLVANSVIALREASIEPLSIDVGTAKAPLSATLSLGAHVHLPSGHSVHVATASCKLQTHSRINMMDAHEFASVELAAPTDACPRDRSRGGLGGHSYRHRRVRRCRGGSYHAGRGYLYRLHAGGPGADGRPHADRSCRRDRRQRFGADVDDGDARSSSSAATSSSAAALSAALSAVAAAALSVAAAALTVATASAAAAALSVAAGEGLAASLRAQLGGIAQEEQEEVREEVQEQDQMRKRKLHLLRGDLRQAVRLRLVQEQVRHLEQEAQEVQGVGGEGQVLQVLQDDVQVLPDLHRLHAVMSGSHVPWPHRPILCIDCPRSIKSYAK